MRSLCLARRATSQNHHENYLIVSFELFKLCATHKDII